VTKRTHEQGQISIFFSASLVVMISIVAFVINIGLFVKAKINLQNATDAAAYSGAAVQARQLTKIAYLNWEMRNIFKEWMYKYYVIGNLNIAAVENPSGSGTMDFALQPDREVLKNIQTSDPFNLPAVCIHIAGSKTNICKRYSIPGLPEFGSTNLPGAEEASRAFMDALIATKVNDCIDRTRLNMLVANTWTYNVLSSDMDKTLAGRGPAILSDRQGAWPKAVELGIRIRNLEYVVNKAPWKGGICFKGSTNLTNCTASVNDVIAESKLGNERLVKAFYSGYRNLGNAIDNEMKETFTLTEIPPTPAPFTKREDASYLLTNPNNNNYEKQYLDLKLMMVNYAIFYAAMIPRATGDTSGACDVSKVAIPVPGYPLGFYKDPGVVTYYAVKGEAEFVGMFNPFQTEGVKLTAYSAAKPFGGRIGPMLFTQKPGADFIIGRTDKQKYRSVPYMTSLKFNGATIRGTTLDNDNYVPGAPLPTDSTKPFWLDDPSRPVGGLVADVDGVQFGLPNLVYDYEKPFYMDGYSFSEDRLHTISAAPQTPDKAVGLYSTFQFRNFKGNRMSDSVSAKVLDEEIGRVKAPTLYEAANYLVPTPNDFNLKNRLDSFGFITGDPITLDNGVKRYEAMVYAPLYQSNDQGDVLFRNVNEVKSAIFEFMRAQESGIQKYKRALNSAAKKIYDMSGVVQGKDQEGSAPGYRKAAAGVSNIDFVKYDPDANPQDCTSINGQFLNFYYGHPDLPKLVQNSDTGCAETLPNLLDKYFSASANDPNYNPAYYKMDFHWPSQYEGESGLKMMSAYVPGPFNGVGRDGIFQNPIQGAEISEVMKRNFYSTKFVTLDSLQSGGGYNESATNFLIYSEGETSSGEDDVRQKNFKNPIDQNVVGDDLSSIKY
jgi:hypothetical protein